jgi:hypothetical protein
MVLSYRPAFRPLSFLAQIVEEDGKENIIYPLDPAPPPLEARRLYSESDFLAAILPMAQRRAEQHEIGEVP